MGWTVLCDSVALLGWVVCPCMGWLDWVGDWFSGLVFEPVGRFARFGFLVLLGSNWLIALASWRCCAVSLPFWRWVIRLSGLAGVNRRFAFWFFGAAGFQVRMHGWVSCGVVALAGCSAQLRRLVCWFVMAGMD